MLIKYRLVYLKIDSAGDEYVLYVKAVYDITKNALVAF